jgi:hypothetical protein
LQYVSSKQNIISSFINQREGLQARPIFERKLPKANTTLSPADRGQYIFIVKEMQGNQPDKTNNSSGWGSLVGCWIYHDDIISFYVNIYVLIKSYIR